MPIREAQQNQFLLQNQQNYIQIFFTAQTNSNITIQSLKMSLNSSNKQNFNILKPQPSPKSIRIALSNITNKIQGKNQVKQFSLNKENWYKHHLQTKDQNKSLNYLNNCQSQQIFQKIQKHDKKPRSLQWKNNTYEIAQSEKKDQNLQRLKRKFNQKKINHLQSFQVEKQSKMLKQIKEFLIEACQTSKQIKQKEKQKQNQQSNQLKTKQKLKKQVQEQRDRMLLQIKQKYQKQLNNIQTQSLLNSKNISREIDILRQNSVQLQQILTDIQNNISNLNNFQEQEFRYIMDHYWGKINYFQKISNSKIKNKHYQISPTKGKTYIVKKMLSKFQDKKYLKQNKSESQLSESQKVSKKQQINFQQALKKVKGKSKLQLFTLQLKKAILDLQKPIIQISQCDLQNGNQQTSRFNQNNSSNNLQYSFKKSIYN